MTLSAIAHFSSWLAISKEWPGLLSNHKKMHYATPGMFSISLPSS